MGALRWDTLRATFVRPERSGRGLPIQGKQDAVTSAKQGGTVPEGAPVREGQLYFLVDNGQWTVDSWISLTVNCQLSTVNSRICGGNNNVQSYPLRRKRAAGNVPELL